MRSRALLQRMVLAQLGLCVGAACAGGVAHAEAGRRAPSSLRHVAHVKALKPAEPSNPTGIAAQGSSGGRSEVGVAPLGDDGQGSGGSAAPPEGTVEVPLTIAVPIEDPSGHALGQFHAALRRAERGEGQAHVIFYGASHTAGDLYTDELRRRLQQRFGDAGTGFVLPAKPWRWYRNAGVDFEPSRGFRTFRIKERMPLEGIYGLAGVALDSRAGRAAESAFATRPHHGLSGRNSRAELYFLKQPGGGHLSIAIDGGPARRIATASNKTEPAYAAFDLPDAPHRFELRTQGDGRVRIFGMALERQAPGVVLDTLGIPGTRVRDQLYWDDVIYREHLARRHADLIVLAYGTNETGDDDVPLEHYASHLRQVLARIRDVAPEASCLLVGPSDRPRANPDGSYGPRPLTDQIIEAQRRAAGEFGCGFFDLRGFMGGPMSMLRWIAAQPPLGKPDHVHFTALGYGRLGEVLYDALLAGFDAPLANITGAHAPTAELQPPDPPSP